PFLAQTIPLFELKKLSIQKLKFDAPALIDTILCDTKRKALIRANAKTTLNPFWQRSSLI
ncbi:MAG: hypothetical protein NZL92_12615, partial [Gloeomargarita sp. SKYG116]|nr:hypothetical protein [Gloeomargarita sp. SKYG116]MDW8402522.1 hypothetical protein [Gloeomargarita sp. SKYGB_i_bin116]